MAIKSNDVSIVAKVLPDVSEVQKIVDKSKIKMDVALKVSNAHLKKLTQDATSGLNESFQLVGNKLTKTVDGGYKSVARFKNVIGETAVVELELNKNMAVTAQQVTHLQQKFNAFEKVLTGVEVATKKYNKNMVVDGKEVKATVTDVTTTHKSQGEEISKVTKRTTEYTTAQGQLVKETVNLNSAGEQVGTTMRETSQDMTKAKQSADKLSQSTKRTGQSFGDVIVKVAKFYTATLPIRAVQTIITKTTEAVHELDDALTEMKKVSSMRGEELSSYATSLAEIGEEVGRTKTEMVQSATAFIKTGASEADAKYLAEVAEMFKNVSDEEISSAESSAFLVSQMRAFNVEAKNTMHIIDGVNEVAANYAVSTGDLRVALEKSGNALGTAGNSYEETIALITGAEEILQGQSSRVGMGLRTISINLTKLASTSQDMKQNIAGVDVQLRSSNGSLLNTYEIMSKLKPTWDGLNDEQKTNLAMTIAGKNRYDVFVATMNNMSQTTKAYETAMNSAGSAERQNEAYMESLSAKLAKLQATFENLVTGSGGLAEVGGFLLSIATAVLKLINALGGLPVVLSTVVTVLVVLNRRTILASILFFFKNLPSLIATAITSIKAFGSALIGAKVSLDAVAGGIGLVSIAITAIIAGISIYNRKVEEQKQQAKEALDTLYQEAKTLHDLEKQVKETGNSKEELMSLVSSSEYLSAYEEEISKIDDEYEARKKVLDIIDEEKKKKAQSIVDRQELEYRQAKKRLYEGGSGEIASGAYDEEFTGSYRKEARFAYNEGITPLTYSGTSQELLSAMSKPYDEAFDLLASDTYTKHKEGLEKYLKGLRELKASGQFEIDSEEYKNLANLIAEVDAVLQETNEAMGEDEKLVNEYDTALKELKGEVEEATQATINFITAHSSWDSVYEVWETLSQSISKVNEKIDSIQSAYASVTTAIDDYNSDGHISIDNLQSLLSLEPKYLNLLTVENGQLKLNEKALGKLLEKQKNKMKVDIYQQTMKQLDIILNTRYTKKKMDEVTVENADTLAKQGNTKAIYEQLKAKIQSTAWDEEQAKQAQKLINTSLKQLALVDELGTQWDNETESTDNNSSAQEKLQSQIDAINKAKERQSKLLEKVKKGLEDEKEDLEELKEKYTSIYDALEYFADKRIDQLQDEIDMINKEAEAVTSNLEQQKQSTSELYEEKIKNLSLENKETERQIELQEKQEALAEAQAKRKLVFKDGRYKTVQDEESVSKAKKELIAKKEAQDRERAKEALEEKKANALQMIEDHISDVKEQQETSTSGIQVMIDGLEDFKKRLSDLKMANQIADYEAVLRDFGIKYVDSGGTPFGSTLKSQKRITKSVLEKVGKINNKVGKIDETLNNLDDTIDNLQKAIDNLDFDPKYNTKPLEKKMDALKNTSSKGATKISKTISTATNDILKLLKKGIKVKSSTGNTNNTFSIGTSGSTITATEKTAKGKAVSAPLSTQYTRGKDGKVYLNGKETGAKITKSGEIIITNGSGVEIGRFSSNTPFASIADYNSALNNFGIKDLTSYAKSSTKNTIENIKKAYKGYYTAKKATGDYSVAEDTFSLIGDSPNQELVIGSKLNGSLTRLQKGTGVVNAKSTKTLAGLMNILGASSTNFGNGNTSNTRDISNNGMSVSINTLNLPQVKNGEDFINYLKNFEIDMAQKAYS